MKFKVNGHEVFASTGGRPFDKKKPLIIFVHGSGLTHMTWVLQTRYFAFHGYNSLAVDLPGHGLSSGESLKSIVIPFSLATPKSLQRTIKKLTNREDISL